MPYDFTRMLGLPIRDSELRNLMEYFEEKPKSSEPDPELDGRYYIEFPLSGFSLLVSGTGITDTVHIYTRSSIEYHAFSDALPFGLTPTTTQTETRKLFGPPSLSGGPIREILPPNLVIYWDRWDYDGHSFHLQYSEHRNSIELITLATIGLC